MATIIKKNVKHLRQFGGAPYGNLSALPFKFKTNASGYFLDSDTPATAVAAADVVRLGVLPAGMRLDDAIAIVSNTFSDTSTFDLGFAYVDGVDDDDVPQDADYFFDAADYHDSVTVLRKTKGTAPVVLPKDAYLILTNNTAAQAEAGVVDFRIVGELQGPK